MRTAVWEALNAAADALVGRWERTPVEDRGDPTTAQLIREAVVAGYEIGHTEGYRRGASDVRLVRVRRIG